MNVFVSAPHEFTAEITKIFVPDASATVEFKTFPVTVWATIFPFWVNVIP